MTEVVVWVTLVVIVVAVAAAAFAIVLVVTKTHISASSPLKETGTSSVTTINSTIARGKKTN